MGGEEGKKQEQDAKKAAAAISQAVAPIRARCNAIGHAGQ
jgi:hypothetical protein